MQDYSKRNRTGSSPSLNRLITLAHVIYDTNLNDVEFIKKRYEDSEVDFDISLSFFEVFGFVKVKQRKLIPVDDFKLLVSENNIDNVKFKELVIKRLLSSSDQSDFISEFLQLFINVKDDFILQLTTDERLKFSEVRNLFVELELMHYDTTDDIYRIDPKLQSKLSSEIQKEHTKLSAEQFAQLLADQSHIGASAELEIINYERKRLGEYPKLCEMIQHVALMDVRAGFDIKSWEIPEYVGKTIARYIEVKAVSKVDFRFMWTSNEMEVAARLGNSYYLYLVPVIKDGNFDLEHLDIIQNPYQNVFLNVGEWTKTENVYTIWKDRK